MVKVTAEDLASIVRLDKATCSGFLRYLERRKLVEAEPRKPAGGKGRSVKVYVFNEDVIKSLTEEVQKILSSEDQLNSKPAEVISISEESETA